MNQQIQALFVARDSGDKQSSYDALVKLFESTEQKVDWAYDVWGGLVADLTHADLHKRSFSAQLLTRLAISDPEGRILTDFQAVASVMRDKSFVTARHTLQSIWRVGVAGPAQARLVLDALTVRFRDCQGEKNASLIRSDIIASLRRMFNALGGDAKIEGHAQALMDSEVDEKARKAQRAAWRRSEP